MRDFNWDDELYCVVKNDGTFAGCPCTSWEEARELQNQHEKSKIFEMKFEVCYANLKDYWLLGD